MSHLQGSCPSCKKPFGDGDDVVICPSCGAPYHRDCYNKEGHCLFEDKHGTGFEYQAAAPDAPPPAGPAPGDNPSDGPAAQQERSSKGPSGMLCPVCGTVNDASNIFCENCGSPLHGAAANPAAGNPFFGGQPTGGPAVNLSGELDGIPKRDWASFIGKSAPTYLQRMEQMERRGKQLSVMASAFFFPPYYFAYRKMWGWAAITLVVTLLLALPSILWFSLDLGQPLLPGLSATMLDTLSLVAYMLQLAMRMVCSLFALSLYRKQGARQIEQLRTQCDGPDYQDALVKKGGVSILGVVAAFALVFAFYGLFFALIGPDFLYFFYPAV